MLSQQDILGQILAQMTAKPRPPPPEEPRQGPERPGGFGAPGCRPPAPRFRGRSPLIDTDTETGLAQMLRLGRDYEVELALGRFQPNGNFSPGLLSVSQYQALKKGLDERVAQAREGRIVVKTYDDKVETGVINVEGQDPKYARRITDIALQRVTYEEKIRRGSDSLSNYEWGYRISSSTERALPDPGEENFVPDVIRYRKRLSYQEKDEKESLYGIKIDLTVVKEVYLKPREGETRSDQPIVKYEVEIERLKEIVAKRDVKHASVATFRAALDLIFPLIQGAEKLGELLTLPRRSYAIAVHNYLFGDEIRRRNIQMNPSKLYKDYWNKPHNIKVDNLIGVSRDRRGKATVDWAITPKLDGKRLFLGIFPAGIFLYGPPNDVILIGEGSDGSNDCTLLDGEFYEKEGRRAYFAFDILFYHGEDVRSKDLLARLELVKKVVPNLRLFPSIGYEAKQFVTKGPLYDKTKAALADIERQETKFEYEFDGIIFQSYGPYDNRDTYKWKPPERLTIDFLLKKVEGSDDVFDAMVSLSKQEAIKSGNPALREVIFKGSHRHPFSGQITVTDGKFNDQSVDGQIVECHWVADEPEPEGDDVCLAELEEDRSKGHFEPVRLRDDRDRPNGLQPAYDVWDDIMSPMTIETIRGDTLKAARRVCNMAKRRLLETEFTSGAVIIDIGTGRGGDQKKWSDAKIKKVFAIEPNEHNYDIAVKRFESAKDFKTEVVFVRNDDEELVGAEDTEAVVKTVGKTKVDGIVSFFSLTFFGKDEDTYNGLLETIDEVLPEGGKFVGIVMDGAKTRELLDKERLKEGGNPEESIAYQTPSFIIDQVSLFKDDMTGNEIEITINDPDSMVCRQTEWLFYFEEFKRDLEGLGIKMIKSGFLDNGPEYDVLPTDSKTFNGLNRMFVFQRSKTRVGKVKYIRPDESATLTNPYKVELATVGVIQDNSNLVHAVLRAVDSSYKAMNEEGKKKEVAKIRQLMAKSLLLDVFIKADVDPETVRVSGQKLAWLTYRLKVTDVTQPFLDSLSLNLLATQLKVNILVVDKAVKVINSSSEPTKHAKTVVLYTPDNVHYNLVAKKGDDELVTVMSKSDSFIKALVATMP